MTALHQITSAGMTVVFSAVLLVTSHKFLEARSAKSALMASKVPISVSKPSSIKPSTIKSATGAKR